MAPAGLYAVLRSRRTYPPASQGKLSAAALRVLASIPGAAPLPVSINIGNPHYER